MRKLFYLVVFLLLLPIGARANQNAQGWCESGAQPVVTSGLTSTTKVQASYPQCTVTVFIHGSGLATIYADNSGTPLANPFTASAVGRWIFYAADGRYDVVLSGGGFPSPVTYSDIILTDTSNPTLTMDTIPEGSFFEKDTINEGPIPTISNGNFETQIFGTSPLPPPGWFPDTGVTVSYETAAPCEGGRSLKAIFPPDPSGFEITENFFHVAAPGDVFYLGAIAKSDGIITAQVRITFLDKTNLAIGVDPAATTASASCTPISVTGTAPAGTVYVIVHLSITPTVGGGTAWYDAINLYRVSYPGPISASTLTGTGLTSGRCVQASTGGLLTTIGAACGTGNGTVTTTGSPASGNLTKFSGGTSVVNGDLSGDCTTSGALALTCNIPAAHVTPGTNGQCLNTAGGVSVWGSCAGTAGVQFLSVNTTPVTVNAVTSSAQTMQQAALAIGAGTLNTLKKTIRVTASGTFTAVNTTESIQLEFSPCAACSLSSLQPPFIANTAAAAYNWTMTVDCTVTATGATGTLVCAASGNIGGSVSTQNTLAQAVILTYNNVDLTGALTPQDDIAFTTASASNFGTSSYFLVEQLN